MESLKQQRLDLITKAHSLKTKKAQAKAWDKVRAVEDQIEDLIRDAWSKISGRYKGTVLMSGTDVMVETEFGTFKAYACNDVLSKSWYCETCCVSFERGQEIEFEFNVMHITHRCAQVMLSKITGGKFDQAEYERLSANPNLAFFKYPTGQSGLSSKAGA